MRRASHSIQDLGGDRKAGEERTQTNIWRPCMMDNNRLSSSSGIILKQEKKLNHQRNSGKHFVKFAQHPVWMQSENATSNNIGFTVIALLYNDNWRPIKGKCMWRLSALSWVYTSLDLSWHKLNAIWWVETERLEIRLRITVQLCEWKQRLTGFQTHLTIFSRVMWKYCCEVKRLSIKIPPEGSELFFFFSLSSQS